MHNILLPNSITFGGGSLREINKILNSLEKKNPLIITDNTMVTLGIIKLLEEYLTKYQIRYEIYKDTIPEPTSQSILKPVNILKEPDLSLVINASEIVGSILAKDDLVIYESTVYPGLTEEICIPILSSFSGLRINKDFFCGYSPERINPADKVNTLTNIVKITSGSNEFAGKFVDNLYKYPLQSFNSWNSNSYPGSWNNDLFDATPYKRAQISNMSWPCWIQFSTDAVDVTQINGSADNSTWNSSDKFKNSGWYCFALPATRQMSDNTHLVSNNNSLLKTWSLKENITGSNVDMFSDNVNTYWESHQNFTVNSTEDTPNVLWTYMSVGDTTPGNDGEGGSWQQVLDGTSDPESKTLGYYFQSPIYIVVDEYGSDPLNLYDYVK